MTTPEVASRIMTKIMRSMKVQMNSATLEIYQACHIINESIINGNCLKNNMVGS